MRAARDLFAKHGFNGVTVRDIAAAAGVNHALLHRYFGTKTNLFVESLRSEVEMTARVSAGPPGLSTAEALGVLRQLLRYVLTAADFKTLVLMIMRAEMDGLAPHLSTADQSFRPLRMLSEAIAHHQTPPAEKDARPQDPRLVSAVLGAALFSLMATAPWLMSAVGLKPEDFETRREEIIDILMGIVIRGLSPERSTPRSKRAPRLDRTRLTKRLPMLTSSS